MMQCKHCGKQLEEDWVVCPFCRTAVSGEKRQEDEQECRADCYEEYESLSPLPPAVRRAYEESRRKEIVTEQDVAVFQGTKALRVLTVIGSVAALFPVAFCLIFVIPFCWDFISTEGLAGALGSVGTDFARYLIYIAAAVGIGGVLGVLAAWARLRRIPLLHRVLAAVMSFVSRVPPIFVLMIGGAVYVTWRRRFVPVGWMCGVFALLGGACFGSLFYERGKTLVCESESPPSVRALVRFLRQGVPGSGKMVRRLYHGGLALGILGSGGLFRDSNVLEGMWRFMAIMSQRDMNYSVFYLMLMIGFDVLFTCLAKRVWKRFAVERKG